MGKFLIIVAVGILFFLFAWFVLGRPIVNRLSRHDEPKLPPVDITSSVELKKRRALLTERRAKLKNKREIAQVDAELAEVNAHLAEMV